MLPAATELEPVSPESALWRVFDPASKTELFSTALNSSEATWLIDPIPLTARANSELTSRPRVEGIIVTNQNHWRAAASLAEQFSVPIFAHPDAAPEDTPSFTPVSDGERLGNFLEVVTVDGAAPGEIAVVGRIEHRTMVLGDALINFEPYGFTFLPRKYCTDYAKMRRSLKRLGKIDVEHIFFAHGLPILSKGAGRLKALLDED